MSANQKQQPICKFYARGHCTKGNACRFRHDGPTGLSPSNVGVLDSSIRVTEDDKAELAQMMKTPPVFFFSSYAVSKGAHRGIINNRDISPEELRAAYCEAKDSGQEQLYYKLEDTARQDMLTLFQFIASDTARAVKYVEMARQRPDSEVRDYLPRDELQNENAPGPLATRYFQGDKSVLEQLRAQLDNSATASANTGGPFGGSGAGNLVGPNAVSPFGSLSTPTQRQQQQQSPAMFGNNNGNPSTFSGFGNNSNSNSQQSPFSGFASNSGGSNNNPSPFASGNTQSAFGASSATKLPPPPGQNAASAFGQTSFGSFANKSSPFGALAAAGTPSSQQASPAFGQSSFGQQQQAAAASPSPAVPFGGGFGQGSAFGVKPTAPAFGQSTFGSSATNNSQPSTAAPTSAFGSMNNNQTKPVFGSSGFGQSPAFGQSSGFGSAPASNSPAPAFGSGSAFGSGNAFGSKPAAPAFGQSAFGATHTFGSQPNTSSSPFGGAKTDNKEGTTKPFGAFATGSAESSSPFSGFAKQAQSTSGSPFASFNSANSNSNNGQASAFSLNNRAKNDDSDSSADNGSHTKSAFAGSISAFGTSNQSSTGSTKPAVSAFGSSAFGQKPTAVSAFGSPANSDIKSAFGAAQGTTTTTPAFIEKKEIADFGTLSLGASDNTAASSSSIAVTSAPKSVFSISSSSPATSAFGQKNETTNFGSQALGESNSTASTPRPTTTGATAATANVKPPAGGYLTRAMQRFPLKDTVKNENFSDLPPRPYNLIEQMISQFAELGRAPANANLKNSMTGNSVILQSGAPMYLPEDADLTSEEREAFTASRFEIGKVPEILPPLKYV
ncbi:uncharacterized protein V2V93DRAFT_368145 [Kockiozyma suomiensis]|uniref:uncharacterized protein n=1 Tax=Kockiozyma suomiensis TaxID=1337062 RepID=UPI003343B20D